MMVTFFLINELAKVSIYRQAAKAMKVILSTVSWMAGEYTPGLTVHIMKENLSTMNEGTVFMSGRWMIRRKEKLKTINLAAGLFFSGQKKNHELSDYFLGKLHAKGFLVISDGNGDFVIGTLKNKGLFILSRRAI